MTQIIRPLSTEQERTRDVSAPKVALSALKFFGILASPIGGLVAVASGILLVRQRKLRPRWYVLGAVVILVGALVTGAGSWWAQTWRQGWSVVEVALGQVHGGLMSPAGFKPVGAALAHWVTINWSAILLHQLPFGLATGLAVGAGWAAFRSRRVASWRSKSPADVMVAEKDVQRAISRLPQWPANAGTDRNGRPVDVRLLRIRFGVACQGRPRSFEVTAGELKAHMLVDAPSQAGKTTLLVEIVAGLLCDPELGRRNCPLVFVTMKPDPTITDRVRSLAEAAGRRFWRVTHDGIGGSHYNPLANRGADQVAGMVIEVEAAAAGGGFTEPHHRATGTRLLRIAARALIEISAADPANWQVDYQHLALLMYPEALERNSDRFSPDLAASWNRLRDEIDRDRDLAHSMGGMRQRVANAAEGGSRNVLPEEVGDTLHLREAIDAGDVVLFDLDAGRDADTARLLANLAVQDLVFSIASLGDRGWNWLRGADRQPMRDRHGDPILDRIAIAVVDEFSALGGIALRSVFERSSGYGCGVILSTQEAGSLDDAGPTFREVVMTNANVKAIFSQGINAESYADVWGTQDAWQESMQTFEDGALVGSHVYKSGQGNLSQVEQYRIHPNMLRSLRPGQAVVGVRTRTGERPSIVQVQRSGSALANRWLSARGEDSVEDEQLDQLDVEEDQGDKETEAEQAAPIDQAEAPAADQPKSEPQSRPRPTRRAVPGGNSSRRATPGPPPPTARERRRAGQQPANQPTSQPTGTTSPAPAPAIPWEDDNADDWPAPAVVGQRCDPTPTTDPAEEPSTEWPLPAPASPR